MSSAGKFFPSRSSGNKFGVFFDGIGFHHQSKIKSTTPSWCEASSEESSDTSDSSDSSDESISDSSSEDEDDEQERGREPRKKVSFNTFNNIVYTYSASSRPSSRVSVTTSYPTTLPVKPPAAPAGHLETIFRYIPRYDQHKHQHRPAETCTSTVHGIEPCITPAWTPVPHKGSQTVTVPRHLHWHGATRGEVHAGHGCIYDTGGKASYKYTPSTRYWVKDENGHFRMRSWSRIREKHLPGSWEFTEETGWMWVRKAKKKKEERQNDWGKSQFPREWPW